MRACGEQGTHSGLDATKAAELLITGLFPLGNKACLELACNTTKLSGDSLGVGIPLLQEPVVQLSADSLSLVV